MSLPVTPECRCPHREASPVIVGLGPLSLTWREASPRPCLSRLESVHVSLAERLLCARLGLPLKTDVVPVAGELSLLGSLVVTMEKGEENALYRAYSVKGR